MGLSYKQRLALLPASERRALLASFPDDVIAEMNRGEWWYVARPEQVPPEGNWMICLALAGRGFGKSRCSSEWIVEQVLKHPFDRSGNPTEWLVVADTLSDARTINADGPSGIKNVLNRRRIDHRYKQSPRPMFLFPDGAKIYLEGADSPDTGRGYNAAGAVLDEIAKWLRPSETWYEGIMPSLRADLIDDTPRAFVTTTPKPIPLLQEWLRRDDASIHVITGSTFDNAANLSAAVLKELKLRYDGTALGEQELYGKLLELSGGGLFQRMNILDGRRDDVEGDRISTVVGVDPNLTGDDAETGIVVVTRTHDNHLWILDDATCKGTGRVAALTMWRTMAKWGADLLVYETNLGKRWMQEVLEDAFIELRDQGMFPRESTPPMKGVDSKHGKKTRAEPVAMRYEQGRAHHVGVFEELESQMVLFDPESTRESPDRMDALVHACRHLMAGEKKRMRVSDPSAYTLDMGQDMYDLGRLLGM